MPDQTPILSLPLILASQAQKHVTHNEALRILDVAVQLAVTNRTRTTAPGTPVTGDRYIVASAATGSWSGQDARIALFADDGWEFTAAKPGWRAHVIAEGATVVFDGISWDVPQTGAANPPMLGINTTADTTNRLAVSSAATLLSHEGAGHQLKLNKLAAGNTASLLFQTGFSGRAEMGTMGDDAFAIKVSSNGSTFAEALRVAGGTGHVSLPGGVLANGFTLRDAGDVTKSASFLLSGITTGTQRSLTLPNISSELAALGGTQSFSGAKTFSGGLTVSGAFQLSSAGGSFGTSTGVATYGVGTGATISGVGKAIDIGTAGLAGSTTTVTVGSAVAGALGSLVVNSPQVTFGASVLDVTMTASRLAAGSLGLGTAPSAANRLNVVGSGTQLSHEGAGHQVRINKAGGTDTASLQFQSGLTGRAELGLIGSNSVELRVSPDGSNWQTALSVAPASGQVTFAQPLVLTGQAADPAILTDGMVWQNSTAGQIRARVAGTTRIIDAQMDIPHLVPVAAEHILTTTGAGGAAPTTLQGAAARIDLFPYTSRADVQIDRLSINVTTAVAAALSKVVVYASDSLGRPAGLIVESADLDCATVGVKSATVSLTLRQGVTYWFGVRHSLTATLSAWALTATPDINGGAPSVSARKTLRRTVTYATAAPANWAFQSSEINAAMATAIWARVV